VAAISESLMDTDEFDRRLGEPLQHLRGVLIARHGLEVGADVHAEVVAYAWENRDRVATLVNPGGYLYRVSQSRRRTGLWHNQRSPIPIALRQSHVVSKRHLVQRGE
jgi:hypothetical protein